MIAAAGLILAAAAAPGRAEDAAPKDIVETGAQLTQLEGEFTFTEGPASDANGDVYFTDQPNDKILRWTPDGKIVTWMEPCGRSNGLCFDDRGSLWACADNENSLWRIGRDKSVTKVITSHEGKLLNGPNDVWIRPKDAGVYITDPFYKRDYWKRGDIEQACQGVYYLPAHSTELQLVAGDLKQPNGIIGTPDGKTLYVADIGDGKTYAYDIGHDGALTNRRLFCSMGSDGMTIDSEGNVYLTGKGVTVFDKSGAQIKHIPVAEDWTGNVCFGGKDRRTLFITASKHVYTIRTRVHGVGSQ
ncbi:gluconolactonase [Capsulimonas corticalis]|uniref:Gluconolactonase n=2 Tax=Capsulimonas corticalis TaxID=2219043 RepID=A0A402D2G3_9BACT|nr:gluconolactonase [Capsulimonas corticalis]